MLRDCVVTVVVFVESDEIHVTSDKGDGFPFGSSLSGYVDDADHLSDQVAVDDVIVQVMIYTLRYGTVYSN